MKDANQQVVEATKSSDANPNWSGKLTQPPLPFKDLDETEREQPSAIPVSVPPGGAQAKPSAVDKTLLSDLCSQINNHHKRALNLANSSLEYALKCGQALVDAKAQLSHGEWIPWLRDNCPDICTRQVQRYMRLAENWPQIQAKREVHPEEMLTVSGALALISDKVAGPNTTSKSHLGAAPEETVLNEDSMTDSNATSSRICQQADIVNAEDSIEQGDDVDQRRVSKSSDSVVAQPEGKRTLELHPDAKATINGHPRLSAEISEVSVSILKPHESDSFVYQDSPDNELIDSIQRFGVLEPLIVSSRGKVIVSGHRRWKAAKQLGMETVPVRFVSHRCNADLKRLVGECNRQRVKTPEQSAREACVIKAATEAQQNWERRRDNKNKDESIERSA